MTSPSVASVAAGARPGFWRRLLRFVIWLPLLFLGFIGRRIGRALDLDIVWPRVAAGVAAIFAIYNPSGYSYVHWARNWFEAHELSTLGFEDLPTILATMYALVVGLAGLCLAVWLIYQAETTRKVLKVAGNIFCLLILAVFFTLVYVVLIYLGVVVQDSARYFGYEIGLWHPGNTTILVLAELGLGVHLGIGMSAAFINRRASGVGSIDTVSMQGGGPDDGAHH